MAFHRNNARDAPLYPAAVFSVVLLAAIASTAVATDWLPALRGRTLDVARAERPPATTTTWPTTSAARSTTTSSGSASTRR